MSFEISFIVAENVMYSKEKKVCLGIGQDFDCGSF